MKRHLAGRSRTRTEIHSHATTVSPHEIHTPLADEINCTKVSFWGNVKMRSQQENNVQTPSYEQCTLVLLIPNLIASQNLSLNVTVAPSGKMVCSDKIGWSFFTIFPLIPKLQLADCPIIMPLYFKTKCSSPTDLTNVIFGKDCTSKSTDDNATQSPLWTANS